MSLSGRFLRAAGAVSLATLLGATSGAAQDVGAPVPQTILFNRDIRPILSENCFTCHGPDRTHRTTLFHFDVEESAKQDIGGGRFAIVPGDLEKSQLIQRVTHPDERRRMPPISTGRKLTERDIALLKEWIRQGAKWEKFWSFEPPTRPVLPKVAAPGWLRNPIDNFVQRRLEEEGLKPSPEADRSTLLRRVTLDLTGKGPTPDEFDAFLADKSPNAYEKVVDRLLKSPHYGERMAVPWLDASRYADTDGYQVDYERFMWRWRDWVINAFNTNMPFDQFTIEQLAGDLLPNPTLDQKIATAFNRNHRTNGEGGIIPEEFAAEYVMDRVATTSSVFLGLTMGCARCHDHKYDPLATKEFYQLYAYFNNVPELGRARRGNSDPYIKAPTTEQQAELKRLDDQLAAMNERLAKLQKVVESAEDAWLKSLAGRPVQWAPLRGLVAYYPLDGDLQQSALPLDTGVTSPADANSSPSGTTPLAGTTPAQPAWSGNAQYSSGIVGGAARFDGSSLIDAGDVGGFDDDEKVTFGAWIYATAGNGTILSKTLDEPEGRGYVLQLRNGKVFFNAGFRWIDHAIRIESRQALELNRWHHVMVSYGGARAARSFTLFVDGVPQTVNVLMDILNESPRLNQPLRIGGGGGPEHRFHGLIDDVRVYNTELSADEVAILAAAKPLNELAALSPSQRSKGESAKIRNAFYDSPSAPAAVRAVVAQLAKLREERARYYETVPTLMVMEEMPTPRETHVLVRGSYDQPGERVTPGVPAILPPMPTEFSNNRLGLARWIVSPSNPLTARVAVNRFWQMYFGTGIVKTVDNFGSQGELPSHPELLDWLAIEFVRTGWNVKELQRLIVTSATYRQRSDATPEMVQRDPENRLMARGARFRLPAETVRDQVLSMANLLVEKVGGPSVKPYQPEGLWTDLVQDGYKRDKYVQDRGEKLYRRSLYTFWKRTIPPPSMANFDAPSRESSMVQRGLTNSPLQTLNLMNDVTFLEAARVLAERMIKEGGATADQRIAFAFRLATGRFPNPREKGILSNSLLYARNRFQSGSENAEQFLSAGEHPRDPKLDVIDLAAYASVANLILNMDETVTKE
jgi:hypothetical protein